MAKNNTAENTENQETGLVTIPRFHMEKPNRRTGEVQIVPKFKYAEGNPREYRADAKNGKFNIQGLTDMGTELVIQPVAWRFFTDELFAMGLKTWAEIFFVDKDNALSVIMFHTHSVTNLENLQGPLFYDDITLADVKIKITWEQHTNDKIKPPVKYCIAQFEHEEVPYSEIEEVQDWASTQRIYRKGTLTKDAFTAAQHNFFNPFELMDQEDPEGEALEVTE